MGVEPCSFAEKTSLPNGLTRLRLTFSSGLRAQAIANVPQDLDPLDSQKQALLSGLHAIRFLRRKTLYKSVDGLELLLRGERLLPPALGCDRGLITNTGPEPLCGSKDH